MNLYPYQVEGARFLAERNRAYLADDMGLGKSAQAIKACDHVKAGRVLVLCPGSVRANWAREFGRFSDYDREVRVLFSGKDHPGGDVVVSSYDLAIRKATWSRLMAFAPDVVILDEAHFLKNREAKRTRATFALVKEASRAWALSGTPAPNNVAELWPLLRAFGFIDMTYWNYVNTFCHTFDNGFGIQITGTRNAEKLRALMAPHFLRRRKDEVLADLPPLTLSEFTVEPNEVDVEYFFPEYEIKPSTRTKDRVARERKELEAQLSSTPEDQRLALLKKAEGKTPTMRRYLGLSKIDGTVAHAEEILRANKYQHLVIFGLHRHVLLELHRRLEHYRPAIIMGETAADKRQARIDRFCNPENRTRVFLGQIKAAGVGIDGLQNITSRCLIVEPSWVPADNAQAIMRLHRHGQRNPVLAEFVMLNDPLDQYVITTIRRKTKDLAQIF